MEPLAPARCWWCDDPETAPPVDDIIEGDGEAPVIVLEGAATAAGEGEGTGPLGGCDTTLAMLCRSGTWDWEGEGRGGGSARAGRPTAPLRLSFVSHSYT